MAKPIPFKKNEYGQIVYSGQCCVCGNMWFENEFNFPAKYTGERYLDGSPIEFSLKYLNYPVFCPYCNNVTTIETPISDVFGVRDKQNDDECKKILNSNEPKEVKMIKIAEYKYKNIPASEETHGIYFLNLYWYYDHIGDIIQRDEYANKFIASTKHNGISNIYTSQMREVYGSPCIVDENLILIDIYRRRGDFKSAYKMIDIASSKIINPDKHSGYKNYLELQRKYCDLEDTNKH